jgi:hypothetical protein
MTMKRQQINNLDQSQLMKLNEIIVEDPHTLFDALGLDFKIRDNKVSTNCVIHGGDNPRALNIYFDGYKTKGYWRCITHNCERDYVANMIGFTRAVLSTRSGRKTSFDDTIIFLKKLYNVRRLKKDSVSEREKKSSLTHLLRLVQLKYCVRFVVSNNIFAA